VICRLAATCLSESIPFAIFFYADAPVTFFTTMFPLILQALSFGTCLYKGRKVAAVLRNKVAKKPRDLRDWATAWEAERASEWAL
jgi:hypothetical protein